MTDHTWVVPATVDHVHDGDTIVAKLDLGWHVSLTAAIRIEGLAAPELSTAAGKAARDYLVDLLPAGERIGVASKRLLGSTEKYGRVLAAVTFNPKQQQRPLLGDVATAMIAAGHGTAWDGTGKQPS